MRNSFNLVFVGLELFRFFAGNRFDRVWEHGGHSPDFKARLSLETILKKEVKFGYQFKSKILGESTLRHEKLLQLGVCWARTL